MIAFFFAYNFKQRIFNSLVKRYRRNSTEKSAFLEQPRKLCCQCFIRYKKVRGIVKNCPLSEKFPKLKSKFCGGPRVSAREIRKYENSIRSRSDYTSHRLKLLGYGLLWLACVPGGTKSTLESIAPLFR